MKFFILFTLANLLALTPIAPKFLVVAAIAAPSAIVSTNIPADKPKL